MPDDVTPGNLGSVPCPNCGGAVFFTMVGGPNFPVCLSCGLSVRVEVVHDGKRWTVRRVRPQDGPDASPERAP